MQCGDCFAFRFAQAPNDEARIFKLVGADLLLRSAPIEEEKKLFIVIGSYRLHRDHTWVSEWSVGTKCGLGS